MSTSIKFAGKDDSNNVTPISVTNEGYVREARQFSYSMTDIVNDVLAITEKTYYPSVDVSTKGLVAIQFWNRSGVSVDLQFYNPITNNPLGNAVAPIKTADGNLPVFTIANGDNVIITPEDLPMLNYCKYINVSLTPAATPTGTNNTALRVITKG